MATFTYNDITYTVVYVDTTGAGGTGNTLLDSRNTFPDFATIPANTCVVVRRTSAFGMNGGATNPNNYVMVIGSPKLGDNLYSLIPDVSTWEADASERFTVTLTTADRGIEFSGLSPRLERAEVLQVYTGTTSHTTNKGIVTCSNTNGNSNIKNCRIALSGGANYTDAQLVQYTRRGICFVGLNSSIDNCDIEISENGIQLFTSGYNCSITNTVVKSWAGRAVYILTGASTTIKMFNCQFYNKADLPCFQGEATIDGDISFTRIQAENMRTYGAWSSGYTSNLINFMNCDFSSRLNLLGQANTSNLVYQLGSINFHYCNFSILPNSDTTGFTGTIYTLNSGTKNYFNCTFDFPGLIGAAGLTAGNNIFSNCTFIKGTPCVNSPLYIPSIIPSSNNTQLASFGNAILYVGSLSMQSIDNAQRSLKMGTSGKIFIDDVDISFGTGSSYQYLNFNASEDSALYVKNENSVIGNWNARSLRTYMNTSNTYRQGSSKNYSIKSQSFSASTGTKKPYLMIAPRPFQGIPVNFGTTGKKKITLYFAHKLYDTNGVNLDDITLEVEIPKSTGTDKQLVSSQFSGNITDDASTWVNDTGLTAKKIEVYFDMLQAGDVYCRIGFYKYNASYPSGYVVIDTGLIGSNA